MATKLDSGSLTSTMKVDRGDIQRRVPGKLRVSSNCISVELELGSHGLVPVSSTYFRYTVSV